LAGKDACTLFHAAKVRFSENKTKKNYLFFLSRISFRQRQGAPQKPLCFIPMVGNAIATVLAAIPTMGMGRGIAMWLYG
jgi:hypothetical protein